MTITQMYVALGIVILAVIALIFFVTGRAERRNRLTPLAGLAFAFILAALFFGENRLIGYILMGIGVLLAVADIVMKAKST